MASLNLTIGALEIGVFISTFLFGVITVQAHIYFRRFPNDGLVIKTLVGTVWLLELGHNICVSHGLFTMTLSQYASPSPGSDRALDPSFSIAVLFSGCIAACVQAYFTHRLRILSGGNFMAVVFWVFSALRLIGWVWAGVVGILACLQVRPGATLQYSWGKPLIPLLAVGALIDFAIAALLCYHFQKSQDTAFKNTSKLLDKLMLWTIQNGLMTSITGVATSICLHTMKTNYVWMAVFMVLTRFFSNSFLAFVNARLNLRRLSMNAATNLSLPEGSIVRFSTHGPTP